jgi:putative mRNA 3-end processing factor
MPYGETRRIGEVEVSFHPAGHVLGSAQVRIERRGEIWIVSGDYKRQADPTCAPFEPVRCHTFITEATFALPIYRWDPTATVAAEISAWWQENTQAGRASVLCAYSLGKAQRLLAELLPHLAGRTIRTHGAIEAMNEVYRRSGVLLPPTRRIDPQTRGSFAGELILAPPAAAGSLWMRRFGRAQVGFASGWMRLRGTRRRGSFDRGFALSDHADWFDLLRTIEESGAERVLATHGYSATLARFLGERGWETGVLGTEFRGETPARAGSDDGAESPEIEGEAGGEEEE